ncbi:MAG TPA: hypothetical protein VED40_16110 [Azospirillaceae bacterium]|nr:hypothetical protein [Azospirillaceae bacterium]
MPAWRPLLRHLRPGLMAGTLVAGYLGLFWTGGHVPAAQAEEMLRGALLAVGTVLLAQALFLAWDGSRAGGNLAALVMLAVPLALTGFYFLMSGALRTGEEPTRVAALYAAAAFGLNLLAFQAGRRSTGPGR